MMMMMMMMMKVVVVVMMMMMVMMMVLLLLIMTTMMMMIPILHTLRPHSFTVTTVLNESVDMMLHQNMIMEYQLR